MKLTCWQSRLCVYAAVAAGLAVAHSALGQDAAPPSRAALTSAQRHVLEDHGIEVTGGAAAGYIDDRECAACHRSA